MSDPTNEPSREPIREPTNDRKKSEPIISYSHIKRDKSTPTFQLVVAFVSNNNALSFNGQSSSKFQLVVASVANECSKGDVKSQPIKWQCRIDIVDLKLPSSCSIDHSRQCRSDFDITLSFIDQSSPTFQLVVASSNNNTLSINDSADWSSATFKMVAVSITIESSKGSFKVSLGAFHPFNGAPTFTAELIVALTSEQSNSSPS